VSQDEIFPSKTDAPWNMPFMVDTADVFQADKSWLKSEASLNISLILVTADVSQDEVLPSKDDAPWNMLLISDTADVFHDEILPLKADAPWNMALIFVT